MNLRGITRNMPAVTRVVRLALAFAVCLGAASPCPATPGASPVRLHGHVPSLALARATLLGRLPKDTQISLALVLPLRNQAELRELLTGIYNPADPRYGQYLAPEKFTQRFGPTRADYDAVAAYARTLGFTVTGTHPNRTLLDLSAPSATTEAAFNLHLQQYQAKDGRKFYAPDNDPEVPGSIASRISGVVGLDSAAVWHTHNRAVSAARIPQSAPQQIGTGPNGALTPGDLLCAYNLQGVSVNGAGQTLGLFELDGYNPADVASYTSYFGLAAVSLQNVLIDGFSGGAGSDAAEVTLDIELQNALAPGASQIIVYEGPNSDTGVVDTYNRIATDNLAAQISTSWGQSEGDFSGTTVISSENAIFEQMAAQGQSIYAASGDSGADANGTTLSVQDPASQPYMVGVGGTELFVNSGGSYGYETTWNVNNTASGGAGGGGISSLWSIPAWQQGLTTAASTTMRNVPDVSLNADQYAGYAIFFQGEWTIYGGTSCAAPLWAAFTALVNQQRAARGNEPLGFANPAIYSIANGPRYGADFHDVSQGTNLYYAAGTGYDNATGWGSFNGANLLSDLMQTIPPGLPTAVTAIAGNTEATVSFGAPTSDGGSAIVSYTVISTPGNLAATGTGSPITVAGLTNYTRYTFTVTATNSVGPGAASASSNSVRPRSPAPPGPPTAVTAAAGNGEALVTLTAPASNGGVTISGYAVTSNPAGGVDSNAKTTSLSHLITGLTNGAPYTFTVAATNSAGTGAASAPSNSVTPAAPPTPPTGVTASAGNAEALVSFDAPDSNGGSAILYYTVTSAPGYLTATGSTSPITVTGLTNGTPYSFTVTATNDASTGAPSAASSEVTASSGGAAPVPAAGPWALAVAAGLLLGMLRRKPGPFP